ncbi:hypothetical protein AB0F17_59675 [Nonomuraea sp. NPDC026600]|uniref:hypothetical protein n=1 Tax=Nonomuraea sp. NPDC026600 TaxID=3155363 RepID=UPI0033F4FE0D
MTRPTSQHRQATAPPQAPPSHGLGLWWTILITGCAISVFLNMWHALTLDKPGTEIALGIIFALVPVLFAAMLSHGLVSPIIMSWSKKAILWTRMAILSLFAVAMLTSIASQAAVMKPYGGGYGAEWSIPLVLDASALLALNFIIKGAATAREAVRQADVEAELATLRAELRPGVAAEVRAELEAEHAAAQAELEAERVAAQAELTTELAGARTALKTEADRTREAELKAARDQTRAQEEEKFRAVRARLEEEYAARLKRAADQIAQRAETETETRVEQARTETEARVRLEMAGENRPKTRPKTAAAPASNTAADGLSRQEALEMRLKQARALLAEKPDINGAELGRALDVSDRYGRKLLEQLAEEDGDGQEEEPLSAAGDVRLHAVP